mgnify:CR=1 FL=1
MLPRNSYRDCRSERGGGADHDVVQLRYIIYAMALIISKKGKIVKQIKEQTLHILCYDTWLMDL